MLMKGRLTINNSVCGRWLLSLFTMLLMSVGMQAEDYGITVAGVEVTDANASNVLGDNITAGTVSFNPQTNTLTLNNVSMNGNVVSSIDNLNVKLVGVSTFNIDNSDGNRHYLFQSTITTATLTFSADELGATLQGYGTTINYKLDLTYWFDVAYDNIDYWSATTTQMDDKDYCQVSKPYVIVDGSAINDANKNNPDRSGVSFDLTNNKVTLSGFQRENQSYNSYSLITSNIANLNVDIQGGLNYIYLNTKKTNEEITSRGFVYTGASGQESSLNVTVAEGSKLLLSWSGQTATTNWLQEGFSQTNMALDKTKMQEAGVLAEAGVPYDYQMTISNYTPPVSYGITVAGVEVNSENASNITGDNITDGTVSFDPQTNTLTMDNVSISAYDAPIVSGLENLTVFLVGANSISGGTPTFGKTTAVEEATITFTTDEESNGSLYIYNLEERLFGARVTPAYTNVSIKHDGDSHTIDSQLGIRVGGVPVTLFNKDNVLGDGKVSYNPETYTLTLNNATIEPEGETPGIVHSNAENLKIALIGNNSIQGGAGCSAISHYGGVETYSLSFAKGNAAQHFSLTLIAQSEDDLIDGFDTNYGDFFVFDNEDDGTYTSTISSSVFGGTGSADEPFLIKTTEDLKDFAYHYNEGRFSNNVHIQLFTDIDCKDEEGFSTIADNTDDTFYGVFDGNHKTISNLTMTGVGFFGFVSKDNDFGVGTIKDLTLSNFNITGTDYTTGGIVATLSDGAVVSHCTVTNSTIACSDNQYNPEVGGIVARLYGSTVTGCTVNNVKVKAETSYTGGSGAASSVGGIVGNASAGTVESCVVVNGSKITNYYADESATLNAGAIVGSQSETTLSENYYDYDVKVELLNGTNISNKIVKSDYTQRGVGGQTYNSQTQQYEDNPDIFEDNGVVMYTKPVTLPAESAQVTVMGEEGSYYSSDVVSDAIVLNVAPGQTATLNARPGEGYAIASLTATNTTTSTTITTSSENIGDNITQYTFTMPDAPVTVAVTTSATLGIIVAGVSVTDQNKSNVLGDGKVSFNSTTNTLTLNGATINGGIVCNIEGTLTVHLLKQNVIDGGYVSANNNGEVAFVGEHQTTNLKITTDANNPGQLLLKRPYINEWNNAEYYSDYMYPSFKNGLVESENYSEKKVLIAVGPTMSPSEGLYWPTQQYTIPNGTQISCSDNAGHSVDVSVTANSFTLTETGKYNISISKAVTVDDTNFSLSNSGHYIVHNKPGFSVSAGSYDEAQTVKLTNLPTLPENSAYYPQVWYYLNNSKNDSIQYTSANQTIAVNESTRVSVYIIDEDSGKVVKSAAVSAQYTIRQDPALRFYTSENSYMSTGSTENISYDDEFTSPVLKGKINGEYTDQLTALGVTYSSSDETVATIDQTGKITIVGGGYATITATSQQTDIYSASTTNFILKVRPADPNVSLEEGAYYTGKKLTMVRIGENGTMYYSYGYKDESERTVYPEGGISLPKGCYDFYPYTRCGTNERNIWSYGNAHRMMYVYDQPTISKDAGTYDGEIEVEITNLPESGSYNADVYYYFDDDEDHAVQYTSGSKITVNESKTLNVYIYVEGDSSKNYKTDVIERQYVIRQDAGLAYMQHNEPVEVAVYTIGATDNEDLPELVNENGVAVTYSSDDENVATVNAETGAVTIVGIGETTITATSAQTATLMAGEASYTLRVYKDLNYESITVTVADATYTGEAVEPEVTVKDGTTDITELMIISYDNNVEVGNNATVTIVPNNDLEVNFYVGSRTETFSIVTRTLEIGSDVTFVSGQKWASFYTTTEDLLLPEGVMAYIVTAVGNDVATVKAINYVPKDVPVLIEKESTTTTDNTSAEGNLLQGTSESTAVSGIEGNVYVLYNGGFTRTTTGAIPARRAYLVLEQAVNARLSIVEGEATDITSVGYDSVATDGSTYDMQGRKVESLSKRGLYIKNGRKVVIK